VGGGTVLLLVGLVLLRAKRWDGLLLGALAALGALAVLATGYGVGQAGGALVYEHGAASAYIETGVDAAGSNQPKHEGERGDDWPYRSTRRRCMGTGRRLDEGGVADDIVQKARARRRERSVAAMTVRFTYLS
jgi:hypothetical protein